jgi:hypothetical protein
MVYATDDLEDALAATREFLLPFEWARWWRLAVVSIFLSSGSALNPPTAELSAPSWFGPLGPVGGPPGGSPPGDGPTPGGVTPPEWLPIDPATLALALGGAALAVGVLLAVVGAVMEFVLVESLSNDRVALRRDWGRRWRQGLRLFGFNAAFLLTALLALGGLVGLGVAPALFTGSILLAVLGLVLLVPVLLAVGLAAAAVVGLTSAFVVPTMVAEDCGVLAGWRRFGPVLRRHPEEYVAFALVYVALVIATGVAVGIAVGVGAAVLAVPFGLLAAFGTVLLGLGTTAGLIVTVAAGISWGAAVLVLLALAEVPVVTYLRYYSLFVLGDTEASLDLIPERRAAIRER